MRNLLLSLVFAIAVLPVFSAPPLASKDGASAPEPDTSESEIKKAKEAVRTFHIDKHVSLTKHKQPQSNVEKSTKIVKDDEFDGAASILIDGVKSVGDVIASIKEERKNIEPVVIFDDTKEKDGNKKTKEVKYKMISDTHAPGYRKIEYEPIKEKAAKNVGIKNDDKKKETEYQTTNKGKSAIKSEKKDQQPMIIVGDVIEVDNIFKFFDDFYLSDLLMPQLKKNENNTGNNKKKESVKANQSVTKKTTTKTPSKDPHNVEKAKPKGDIGHKKRQEVPKISSKVKGSVTTSVGIKIPIAKIVTKSSKATKKGELSYTTESSKHKTESKKSLSKNTEVYQSTEKQKIVASTNSIEKVSKIWLKIFGTEINNKGVEQIENPSDLKDIIKSEDIVVDNIKNGSKFDTKTTGEGGGGGEKQTEPSIPKVTDAGDDNIELWPQIVDDIIVELKQKTGKDSEMNSTTAEVKVTEGIQEVNTENMDTATKWQEALFSDKTGDSLESESLEESTTPEELVTEVQGVITNNQDITTEEQEDSSYPNENSPKEGSVDDSIPPETIVTTEIQEVNTENMDRVTKGQEDSSSVEVDDEDGHEVIDLKKVQMQKVGEIVNLMKTIVRSLEKNYQDEEDDVENTHRRKHKTNNYGDDKQKIEDSIGVVVKDIIGSLQTLSEAKGDDDDDCEDERIPFGMYQPIYKPKLGAIVNVRF